MASRSLNRVVLIGNLTRDPELKYTPSGTAVCTFGVATNRSWTTNDGQTKDETQFHRIVAWQKLAELCGKLLTKGKKVFCEGRITYRTFTGKDGQQKTIAEIVLDDFIVFGDSKRALEADKATEKTEESPAIEPTTAETKSEETQSEPKTNKTKKETASENETVNPDDIPF